MNWVSLYSRPHPQQCQKNTNSSNQAPLSSVQKLLLYLHCSYKKQNCLRLERWLSSKLLPPTEQVTPHVIKTPERWWRQGDHESETRMGYYQIFLVLSTIVPFIMCDYKSGCYSSRHSQPQSSLSNWVRMTILPQIFQKFALTMDFYFNANVFVLPTSKLIPFLWTEVPNFSL